MTHQEETKIRELFNEAFPFVYMTKDNGGFQVNEYVTDWIISKIKEREMQKSLKTC